MDKKEFIENLTPNTAQTVASSNFYETDIIVYINRLLHARAKIMEGVNTYIREREDIGNINEINEYFRSRKNIQMFYDALFYVLKAKFSGKELNDISLSQPNSKNLLKAYSMLAENFNDINPLYSKVFRELQQSSKDSSYEISTENRWNV